MTPTVPPDQVAAVRRRYADGEAVAAIQADTGLASNVLYRCLDGRYDDGSGAPLPLPAIPRRRSGKRAEEDDAPARRRTLVDRLWRNAEIQVDQIEARLAQSGIADEESERGARTLAIVVRTLRELAAFDACQEEKNAENPSSKTSANDKAVPRDIDELRRQLAQKLEDLVRDSAGAGEGSDLESTGGRA